MIIPARLQEKERKAHTPKKSKDSFGRKPWLSAAKATPFDAIEAPPTEARFYYSKTPAHWEFADTDDGGTAESLFRRGSVGDFVMGLRRKSLSLVSSNTGSSGHHLVTAYYSQDGYSTRGVVLSSVESKPAFIGKQSTKASTRYEELTIRWSVVSCP